MESSASEQKEKRGNHGKSESDYPGILCAGHDFPI